MIEVPDLRGDLVQVGDTIAYAATDGRSGGIRIGKVLEIIEAHDRVEFYDHLGSYTTPVPTKIKVEVDFSSGYFKPGKPTLIQADFKRFVKVGS